MNPLTLSQPTVENLFANYNRRFFIPIYQRPYSWSEEQCAELWQDLCNFAFPNDKANAFDRDKDSFFLGIIVTYPNEQDFIEVVDGQQRITSLLLLMRAIYTELSETDNGRTLGKCIWYFGEEGTPDLTKPRIISESSLEYGKAALKQILETGTVLKGDDNNCTSNYKFFRKQIADFMRKSPRNNLEKLASRLLRNVFFTQIEARSEDEALNLFLTINDRGMPLRIADIFQGILYQEVKLTRSDAELKRFLDRWQRIDETAKAIFDKDKQLTPIEFAFLLYARAKLKKNVTWKDLKRVYSDNNYALLKDPQTLNGVEDLLQFFSILYDVDSKKTSLLITEDIAQKVYTLFRMHKTVTFLRLTAYYSKYHSKGNNIFDKDFSDFLDRTIAFIVRVSVVGEFYTLLSNVTATNNLLDENIPEELKLTKQDVSTKIVLTSEKKDTVVNKYQNLLLNWWTFSYPGQPRVSWETKFELEHIFAKSLIEYDGLANTKLVNAPGNLALFESKKNRKASNISYSDKRKLYAHSCNVELNRLAAEYTKTFSDSEITIRNQQIISGIIDLLRKTGFLKE